MIAKSLLKQIIVENREFIEKKILSPIRRDLLDSLPKPDRAIIFYGVRRAGKTFLLYEIFRSAPASSLYLDFEDERLAGFVLEDFETVREAFFELNPDFLGAKNVQFLFDEIQRIKEWEGFARRMLEKEGVVVYAAGSSTRIHPENIGTALRGRFAAFELYPFSFREFIRLRVPRGDIKPLLFGRERVRLKRHFEEYLRWGGLPEIIRADSEIEKARILKEYLNAIYFRDLVERFEIKNFALFNALWDFLFSSFAAKFSINSFGSKYRDEFPFSKDSLYAYYRGFTESRMILEVRKYAESSYRRLKTPVKIYIADNGLARRITSRDSGRLLENLVLLELKRRGKNLFYFEGKRECDFVAVGPDETRAVFQVVFELNENTRKREAEGLVEAAKALGLKDGTILSNDQEDSFTQESVRINVLPVWKWSLTDNEFQA